jgi:hypothetical protein
MVLFPLEEGFGEPWFPNLCGDLVSWVAPQEIKLLLHEGFFGLIAKGVQFGC